MTLACMLACQEQIDHPLSGILVRLTASVHQFVSLSTIFKQWRITIYRMNNNSNIMIELYSRLCHCVTVPRASGEQWKHSNDVSTTVTFCVCLTSLFFHWSSRLNWVHPKISQRGTFVYCRCKIFYRPDALPIAQTSRVRQSMWHYCQIQHADTTELQECGAERLKCNSLYSFHYSST